MKAWLASLFFIPVCAWGQSFVVRDLTAENLFTQNIEGPNTNDRNELFVVNFEEDGTIGQVAPNGMVTRYVTLPKGSIANAIVFDPKGDMLLADWTGHQILRLDHNTRQVSVLCYNAQFNQPNDICINRKGQLFASDPNWKAGTGRIWRIDPDGKSTLLLDSLGTTNGIALSQNQKTLYVNESLQRLVWKYTIDSQGNLRNKKIFARFNDFGLDGMKCDTRGNLYITRYDKGTIVVMDPNGSEIREIQLKGKKVSNLTFGGVDGKTCYATLQDRKCLETFRIDIAGKVIVRAGRR
ncbi:MAG TPA: SMP-30/gluconolactonase/LRE family protein [Cyclobacteriaceae bacterium]|nr:SMP-30/gluconolactonase/LRE family protein [Cyclobacteriaceae bacterium]